MSSGKRKSPLSKAPQRAFANIEFLVNGNGAITIGRVGRLRCVASASDEDQCLAMLRRRPTESLIDLLERLDAAIDDAYEKGNCIDEVNVPQD